MSSLPKAKLNEIDRNIEFPKYKNILIVSIISYLIPTLITLVNGLLSNFLKIIISLAIACLVLFIDVIVLYVRERNNYFINKQIYSNQLLLDNNYKIIHDELDELRNIITQSSK